jgi:hypothetical protein
MDQHKDDLDRKRQAAAPANDRQQPDRERGRADRDPAEGARPEGQDDRPSKSEQPRQAMPDQGGISNRGLDREIESQQDVPQRGTSRDDI